MNLPLFPLNVVLYPFTPLPLHIFEDRYKDMIRDCLDNGTGFGIAMITEGVESLGPLADTAIIGCSAKIIKTAKLPMGRMNLLVLGQGRFRIQEISQSEKAYLEAEVEFLPAPEPNLFANRVPALQAAIGTYLDALRVPPDKIEAVRDSDDPWQLANLGASVLQIPLPQKQDLLETEDATEFTDIVLARLEKEEQLLRALEKVPKAPKKKNFPFSLN